MSDGDPIQRTRTPEEFVAELEKLSDEAWARLEVGAGYYARSAWWLSADDLLHDAIVAATEGNRRCRVDTDICLFLLGTMRSIVSNERPKQRFEPTPDDELLAAAPPAPQPTPEQVTERRQLVDDILAAVDRHFAGDPRPALILQGRMEGMSREEIRGLVEMTTIEFESMERALRRFAARYRSEAGSS
jgi:DNA-directed RNA polymerase specialized sigma24 family protein